MMSQFSYELPFLGGLQIVDNVAQSHCLLKIGVGLYLEINRKKE